MVSKTKSVKTAWLLLCLKVNNMEYKVSNPQTKEPGDGCVKPVYDFESSAWRLHNNGQQHGKYYIHFETVYFDYFALIFPEILFYVFVHQAGTAGQTLWQFHSDLKLI